MDIELRKAKNIADKYLVLFLLMNEWVKIKQMNLSVADVLMKYGYRRIGIYGMSYVGQRLVDELENTAVEIKCCIDKNTAGSTYKSKKITTIDSIGDNVDCIVVTPVFYFDEIAEEIKDKVSIKVVSLEEIIYGLTVNV